MLALGSNKRHPRHGGPRQVLAAALAELAKAGIAIEAVAPVITSLPIGPSHRCYANGAALVRTALPPPGLLALLKQVESHFGRRRQSRRWSARVLDLDIVLWSGGPWRSPGLTIPHLQFRERAFVLAPARRIAPGWRDPATGLTVAHLQTRLTRPRPLPKRKLPSRPADRRRSHARRGP